MRIYTQNDSVELKEITGIYTGDSQYYSGNDGHIYRKYKGAVRDRDSKRVITKIRGENYKQVKGYTSPGRRKSRPVGYAHVDIGDKRYSVHRLIAKCYCDNPLNKPFVNHKDGNIHNNLPENLEWVTNSENVLHAFRVLKIKNYGGRKKGIQNSDCKILYDKIQNLLETTCLQKDEIAKLCGCTYEVVKRAHRLRKVVRPKEYDYRVERFKRNANI